MSMLEVKDLSIHFGGVKAVQNVTFNIDSGIVYSVIGPNGAGKTTLFNLITGVYKPTTGEIKLDGEAIHGKSPNELARRGVAHNFQNLQICMNMSAIENVRVGAHLRLDRNLVKAALRFPGHKKRDAELREEVAELMRFVGLGQYVEARADAMSYGALKRLEIARALAMKPRLSPFAAKRLSMFSRRTTGRNKPPFYVNVHHSYHPMCTMPTHVSQRDIVDKPRSISMF